MNLKVIFTCGLAALVVGLCLFGTAQHKVLAGEGWESQKLDDALKATTFDIYILDQLFQAALDPFDEVTLRCFSAMGLGHLVNKAEKAVDGSSTAKSAALGEEAKKKAKKLSVFLCGQNKTYNSFVFDTATLLRRDEKFKLSWTGLFFALGSLQNWSYVRGLATSLNEVRFGRLAKQAQSPHLNDEKWATARRNGVLRQARDKVLHKLGPLAAKHLLPVQVWFNPTAPANSGLGLQVRGTELLIVGPTLTQTEEDNLIYHEAAHLPVCTYVRNDLSLKKAIARSSCIYDLLPLPGFMRGTYPTWSIYFEEVFVRALAAHLQGASSTLWDEQPFEQELQSWLQQPGELSRNMILGTKAATLRCHR